MKTTVARAIAEVFAGGGVEYFFLLTGGDQPLWIALRDRRIRMLLARSEAAAVYMADGYARASGKPGLTYGQAGPGAANVAAALADPYWAQSPVVAVTGTTATRARYKVEYQAIEDQAPLFAPVTIWQGEVGEPGQAPALVALALHRALVGSRGPTHIDIPKDFFGREIEWDGASRADVKTPPAVADLGVAREFLDRLLVAERPIVVAGEGVVRAGAEAALQAFVESLGVPVGTTMGGKTSLPSHHPLNVGVIGRYSAKVANEVVGACDCALVIGSRMGGLATNGYTVPPQTATILQVDSDPWSVGLTYQAAQCMIADARLALEVLVGAAGGRQLGAGASAWADSVRSRVVAWRDQVRAASAAAGGDRLSPLAVIAALSAYNQEITVVADTGYSAAWTGVLYPTVRPQSYFRAVGSLGWALPGSLGVQVARPEKVVCVIGDGGLGYHLADIETAVRLRLPVVVVVLNNGGLMFEYHEQKYRHQGQVVPEANDLTEADYAMTARGLGAEGVRVQTGAEFESALKTALGSERPTVLDVLVDRETFPPVTNFERTLARTI